MIEEDVTFEAEGEKLVGVLFHENSGAPAPALVLCHGALEFKEHFFELGRYLAARGIAALALDMRGHGESEGPRYHVRMAQWTADVHAALSYLARRPDVDGDRLGSFGFSSGGTTVLEAALVDPRLRALVTLDGTVRNTLSRIETLALQALALLGTIKRKLTGSDLRISLLKTAQSQIVAHDPQVNQAVQSDPRMIDAYENFPLPGALECFVVDMLERVSDLETPTLVIHGAKDELDPVENARLLYNALQGPKALEILPKSGHMGHLDCEKARVFALTAKWARTYLS